MKKTVICVIIITLIVGAWGFRMPTVRASQGAYVGGHVQAGIWDHINERSQPEKALLLEMDGEQWEATVAVSATVAFIDRTLRTPIFFHDGTNTSLIDIPHDTRTVRSFGSDAAAATAAMATTYWSKAEIAVVTDTYEHALWSVPVASFLSAPILIDPSPSTLATLGTKCVIAVGNPDVEAEEIVKLSAKEDLWKFQLELFDTRGQVCDYVIMTNPHDTDDEIDINIKWSRLSMAAAPLAAYRRALVQTGDWTADKSKIEMMEKANQKDDALYAEMKGSFGKVKQDSYDAEKFLMDHGHEPEYLAVVGGPYSVPNYFYDIHVDYVFPLPSPQKTVYPSSIGAYATLQESVVDDEYTKEDLAAGRIMASSVFDAGKQVMNTIFYREFIPGGLYGSVAPSNWQRTASIIDGHRLNQPEDYPNGLLWVPEVPYHPSHYVMGIFENASFDTEYYLVRNESDPYDTNKTVFEYMDIVTGSSLVQFLPHGGSTYLRIEVGVDPVTKEERSVNLRSSDVWKLNFKAPTICYATCCKSANPFMLDAGKKTSDFMVAAFVHAGCAAFIGTPEIQSTCFWDEAPIGVSTEQNILAWQKVLGSNMPLGKALGEAKWEAYLWAREKWPAKAGSDATFDVDCMTYNLFGDPALEPYKPDTPFATQPRFEFGPHYDEPVSGEFFDVSIKVIDPETGAAIEGATITVEFDGQTRTGGDVRFTAPEKAGDYRMEITVEKAGYEDITARYWLHVKDGGNDGGMLIWIIVMIVVMIVIILIIVLSRRSGKENDEDTERGLNEASEEI